MIVFQQLASLLGEGGPVAGAILDDRFDGFAEHATAGVDFIDCQFFRVHHRGFAHGHGAGKRVNDAYLHGVCLCLADQ
ncbi:hypothetical protein D3C71_2001010 [compost metagenome]